MNHRILILVIGILLANSASAQDGPAEISFVLITEFGVSTTLTDSTFRVECVHPISQLGQGFLPSQIQIGHFVFDSFGRRFRVKTIESSNFGESVLTVAELQDQNIAPVGVGVVYEKIIGNDQIPIDIAGDNFGLSPATVARMRIHNSNVSVGVESNPVSSISADNVTVSPIVSLPATTTAQQGFFELATNASARDQLLISLRNLTGMPFLSDDLGLFNSIIPDNSTIKAALEAVVDSLNSTNGLYSGSGVVPNNTVATSENIDFRSVADVNGNSTSINKSGTAVNLESGQVKYTVDSGNGIGFHALTTAGNTQLFLSGTDNDALSILSVQADDYAFSDASGQEYLNISPGIAQIWTDVEFKNYPNIQYAGTDAQGAFVPAPTPLDSVWMTYASDTSSITLFAIKGSDTTSYIVPLRAGGGSVGGIDGSLSNSFIPYAINSTTLGNSQINRVSEDELQINGGSLGISPRMIIHGLGSASGASNGKGSLALNCPTTTTNLTQTNHALVLVNNAQVDNTWVKFSFGDGSNNAVGASIAHQITNHSSNRGILTFATRGSSNSLSERMRISENGNIGIGLTSNAAHSLSVSHTGENFASIKLQPHDNTVVEEEGVIVADNSENRLMYHDGTSFRGLAFP